MDSNRFDLRLGDCLNTLRAMPDNSVDSIVTDPPYGLSDHKPADVTACLQAWLAGEPYMARKKGFMGKTWDSWVPGPEVWRECLRVLKPGGHLLAFAGTRTMDLMSMAVRLAGFELRDSIGYAHDGGGAPVMAYCYGSGFPKSTDVSKQIDKLAGAEREVVGRAVYGDGHVQNSAESMGYGGCDPSADDRRLTAPATDAARQWQGWGSALKPAWEPIIIARKPLIGTIAQNVLAHGTGALNIDGCRVGSEVVKSHHTAMLAHGGQNARPWHEGHQATTHENTGRWPANLIHDGSDEVVGLFPANAGGGFGKRGGRESTEGYRMHHDVGQAVGFGDTGSAARFFYCAKASKRDRGEGNTHPTVKPTDLMRYLCRLVTPPGGVVLDPFMGSGSTGKAAMLEGFRFIGCELSPEYLEIARARIAHAAGHGAPADHAEEVELFAAE